jgi:hypothetical protein
MQFISGNPATLKISGLPKQEPVSRFELLFPLEISSICQTDASPGRMRIPPFRPHFKKKIPATWAEHLPVNDIINIHICGIGYRAVCSKDWCHGRYEARVSRSLRFKMACSAKFIARSHEPIP